MGVVILDSYLNFYVKIEDTTHTISKTKYGNTSRSGNCFFNQNHTTA